MKSNKVLIRVNNEKIQSKIFEKYNIKVPLYMVFDSEDMFYNSPLWFEMWSDKEFID